MMRRNQYPIGIVGALFIALCARTGAAQAGPGPQGTPAPPPASSIPLVGGLLEEVGNHPVPLLFVGLGSLVLILSLQSLIFWRTKRRLDKNVSEWDSLRRALEPYALSASPEKLVLSRPF